jgi:hypothetical protein
MESVDAKMIRAHEHLESLAAETNAFLGGIKRTMILKTYPGEPTPSLMIWVDDPYPPVRLSVIAGDCIHNMRSALDNLVCGLVLTADPAGTCGSAFPICATEPEWERVGRNNLSGIPEAARSVIRGVQPWANTRAPSPLTVLQRLNNKDKHRHLNFMLAYDVGLQFVIHSNSGDLLYVRPNQPVYLGEPQTIPLDVEVASVTPSARVEAVGTTVLTFRDEGPWNDTPVCLMLQRCFDYVEREVIGALKVFFEPKHEP